MCQALNTRINTMFTKGNKAGGNKKGSKSPGSGKTPDWLKEKCQNIVDKNNLIEFLGKIASSEDQNTKDRMKAIEMLLDRGFGKPQQTMEHSGDKGRPLTINILDYAKS